MSPAIWRPKYLFPEDKLRIVKNVFAVIGFVAGAVWVWMLWAWRTPQRRKARRRSVFLPMLLACAVIFSGCAFVVQHTGKVTRDTTTTTKDGKVVKVHEEYGKTTGMSESAASGSQSPAVTMLTQKMTPGGTYTLTTGSNAENQDGGAKDFLTAVAAGMTTLWNTVSPYVMPAVKSYLESQATQGAADAVANANSK